MTGRESAMQDEFDVLAGWTVEAIRELGPEHGQPAACRGTSSPAMLTWFGQNCGLTPGELLLDVGGGMGGPAAFAAEHFGVRPIVADPMPRACRAATELFGIDSLVASGARIPVATGTVDAVWCLGVLCTTTEKAATLAELRRVARPGSSLGLMVLTADEPHPPGAPEGNVFPRHEELRYLLRQAGFDLVEERDATGLDEPPEAWTLPLQRVKDAVHENHWDDPRLAAAEGQEAQMSALFDTGDVQMWLLHARARSTVTT